MLSYSSLREFGCHLKTKEELLRYYQKIQGIKRDMMRDHLNLGRELLEGAKCGAVARCDSALAGDIDSLAAMLAPLNSEGQTNIPDIFSCMALHGAREPASHKNFAKFLKLWQFVDALKQPRITMAFYPKYFFDGCLIFSGKQAAQFLEVKWQTLVSKGNAPSRDDPEEIKPGDDDDTIIKKTMRFNLNHCLRNAIVIRHVEAMKWLLAKGAVLLRRADQRKVLGPSRRCVKMLRLLLDHTTDINWPSLWRSAVERGYPDCLAVLLEKDEKTAGIPFPSALKSTAPGVFEAMAVKSRVVRAATQSRMFEAIDFLIKKKIVHRFRFYTGTLSKEEWKTLVQRQKRAPTAYQILAQLRPAELDDLITQGPEPPDVRLQSTS